MYSLLLARFVVPALTMDEKHGEVNHVEVRDGSVEAGRQRPGERHDQVAPVKAMLNLPMSRYVDE